MPNSREDYIKKFHEAFGLGVEEKPSVRNLKLRKTLIKEEVDELMEELDKAISAVESGEEVPKEVFVHMLKELADVQVVVSGTAVQIKPLKNLEEAFLRVHESNMSKLGEDGKPILREDGKTLKGPNYEKPDLNDIVE